MDEQLIMTIKEFHKAAGKEAARFSDNQIVELIMDLDFMAKLFIQDHAKTIKRLVPKSG
jgi:hypothetical protein